MTSVLDQLFREFSVHQTRGFFGSWEYSGGLVPFNVAQFSAPTGRAVALPRLLAPAVLASRIGQASGAVGTGPSGLAPTLVGPLAEPVLRVTSLPALGHAAKVALPSIPTLALQWLVAIPELGTAWQLDANVTVLTSPARMAKAFSWHGTVAMGTPFLAFWFVAEHSLPAFVADALEW